MSETVYHQTVLSLQMLEKYGFTRVGGSPKGDKNLRKRWKERLLSQTKMLVMKEVKSGSKSPFFVQLINFCPLFEEDPVYYFGFLTCFVIFVTMVISRITDLEFSKLYIVHCSYVIPDVHEISNYLDWL